MPKPWGPMNRLITCLAACAALSCGTAFAADPVVTRKSEDSTGIIANLELKDNTLEDAIMAIRQSIPSFNATVVREPGVPSDYPKITMRLTNWASPRTVGATCTLIQARLERFGADVA